MRRLVQEAEAELAGKRRDAEKLHPQVDKYGQVIPELESEYERRLRYWPRLRMLTVSCSASTAAA